MNNDAMGMSKLLNKKIQLYKYNTFIKLNIEKGAQVCDATDAD